MQLTGKQRRYLRGLGHHLKPIVFVGKEELSTAVISATEEALEAHELIKIKLQESCLSDRHAAAEHLAAATSAAIVQVLGKSILLFRPGSEQKITLPQPR